MVWALLLENAGLLKGRRSMTRIRPAARSRLVCAALSLSLLAGCGSAPQGALGSGRRDAPTCWNPGVLETVQLGTRLRHTLDDLAAMGSKRAGTDAGQRAAEYLRGRMVEVGLEMPRFESFHFPRHDVTAASLTILVDGAPLPMDFDVFEASGSGTVMGPIVDVGTAHPDELNGRNLQGQVALVRRSQVYHRAAQLKMLVAVGASAMLYQSEARDNLRQVGSVRYAWEPMVAIPGFTIGSDDGDRIRAAMSAGSDVRADLNVQVSSTPASGQNVIGTVTGQDDRKIVIGAHYDTWFAGSGDNGSGVASLLEIARQRALGPRPPHTLVFVLFDGEEVALYGAYDFLRKHGGGDVLAMFNLEVPAADPTSLVARGIASSGNNALSDAIAKSGLAGIASPDPLTPFRLWVSLDAVEASFGGIIPADVQAMYRAGIASVSTTSAAIYYHTAQDTPEHVSLPALVPVVTYGDCALLNMLQVAPLDYSPLDPTLWQAEVGTNAPGEGGLKVNAIIKDAQGMVLPDAAVSGTLFCDDFFERATVGAITDPDGGATLEFDPAATAGCPGSAWLHVSAGDDYPRVERVLPILF
jgi:Zn-dependent M28 family amino/carboxypeptidase